MHRLIDKYLTNAEQRVLRLALSSRLVVLLLMAFVDTVFADLDSSSHLQNFPCGSLNKNTPFYTNPSWLGQFLDGLAPWDSVYFVRIAKCGYETDMMNAFFPFLPFLMRYGARYTGLEYLAQLFNFPIESMYTALGLEINVIAFCVAALALHRLSNKILNNEELASLSVLLFSCNPASVFYSAAYTEAIFAACTWTGLVLLSNAGGDHGGISNRSGSVTEWVAGVLALSFAGATRSNGILSAWFLLHNLIFKVCASSKSENKSTFSLWKAVMKTVFGCAVVWTPYISMQVYGYQTYCTDSSRSRNWNASQRPAWCSNRLPSLYGYVQKAYWDVGFLRFYRYLNRWPWLLQSAPVFYIAIVSCWTWMSADWIRAFSLGVFSSASKKKTVTAKRKEIAIEAFSSPSSFLLNEAIAPYIYHLAGMTAIALFTMHVNVATRFLSSSPALYWGAAVLMKKQTQQQKTLASDKGIFFASSNWIWLWAMVSAILGCLLFPNFFPWT